MIKYFHDPDQSISYGIYSDEDNHAEIADDLGDIAGIDIEQQIYDYPDYVELSTAFERDTVIIRAHMFQEGLLDLIENGIGLYIV